jgi:hypothetical protein
LTPKEPTTIQSTAFNNVNWGESSHKYLFTIKKQLKELQIEKIVKKAKEHAKRVCRDRGAEFVQSSMSLGDSEDEDPQAQLVYISDDKECK